MKKFGILGGGIAGLSLSYFLGADSEILEKNSVCGGLCRTFEEDGFVFDLGGHIMFSSDKEILNFELDLLKDKLNRHFRHASVWFKGRHVKYPFENGLSALDKEDIFYCLHNFLENPQRPQHNFEDWIYNTFGKGFAELYMVPYNTKIWKTPPRELGTHWVERIPKPPAKDVLKSALGIETEGNLEQLHFYYPKTGGFQTLPDAFEEQVHQRVRTSFPVVEVRKTGSHWQVSNGHEAVSFERLINTMPIFEFIRTIDAPEAVQQAVDALKYNSLIVVMIGLNFERKVDKVATYFPQPDLIFHRAVFFDYFGKNYVPTGCSSIVTEITSRPDELPGNLPDDEIVEEVIRGLVEEGFCAREDVIKTSVRRVRYAYPLYDLNREKNLEIIHGWCREQDIELCGRFAEFRYVNSDAVIRSARQCAERLLGGPVPI